jgi:hypothetical protein
MATLTPPRRQAPDTDTALAGPLLHTLDAAATYLRLDPGQMHAELAGGASLAGIAGREGRRIDGLVAAMVDEGRERLEQHLLAGAISVDQFDHLFADLEERIVAVVVYGGPPG